MPKSSYSLWVCVNPRNSPPNFSLCLSRFIYSSITYIHAFIFSPHFFTYHSHKRHPATQIPPLSCFFSVSYIELPQIEGQGCILRFNNSFFLYHIQLREQHGLFTRSIFHVFSFHSLWVSTDSQLCYADMHPILCAPSVPARLRGKPSRLMQVAI